MITFFIIIVLGFIIYKAIVNPSDKKDKKEIVEDKEKIAQLPDICFKGKELSSLQRAANMFPGKKDILDIFKYNSSDHSIYMKMLDGRNISCFLSELDVTFDKVSSIYRFLVTDGKTKFSFYQFDFVFSKEQYEVITGVLLLAGTTHNKSIMGSTYKNMSRAATVIKIMSKL